jgi:hypothetical protein
MLVNVMFVVCGGKSAALMSIMVGEVNMSNVHPLPKGKQQSGIKKKITRSNDD